MRLKTPKKPDPTREAFQDALHSIMLRWISASELDEPVYECAACKDLGAIEDDDGRYRDCRCRIQKRIANEFKRFGFDPKAIKGFARFEPKSKDHAFALRKAIEFAIGFQTRNRHCNGLMFCGTPGTGKTHLALAVAKRLIERNRPVRIECFPYILSMSRLKGYALYPEKQEQMRSQYMDAECLMIEDLYKNKSNSKTPLSEPDIHQLFPIIDYRASKKLPVIVTTELTPDEITNIDEGIGRRLLELCGGGTFTFGKDSVYRT